MMSPKRRALSPAEKARVVLRQDGRCACGCGEKLNVGKIDFDHRADNWAATGGALDLTAMARACLQAARDKG